MSEPTRDPALAALEAALRALPPAPAGLDRDRLMFQAGQARRPHPDWLWPCTTAALALVAVGLGTALVLRSEPQVVERVVVVHDGPQELQPQPNDAPAAMDRRAGPSYFQVRDQVLRRGLDGLPELPPAPPLHASDSLDKILN